jgi:hypothetical protein
MAVRLRDAGRESNVPALDPMAVTAIPVLANGRSRPDTGARFPAIKATVDGLVDAGVIPNDTPDHVTEIGFSSPAVGSTDSLVLVVVEVLAQQVAER